MSFKTVGYFTNWGVYGRNYQPQDIPADHLTHILYSFANVRPESGEVYLTDTYSDLEKHYPTDSWNDVGTNVYGCIKQLFLLKKKHRHFKTLLSIGGWTYSANFQQPASTPSGRETFARTAVTLLGDLGFDGLDIDWEYPQNATEAENFVLLLAETRRRLDEYSAEHAGGKRLLLTIAAPCGKSNYEKLRMREMDQYLDFWNLMCYDFSGSWDANAGHMANVYQAQGNNQVTPYNAHDAIQDYIRGGVHPSKIIFGMPLYGRAFENTDGPGKPFQGVGEGSWENGVWDYKALPRPDSQEHVSEDLVASWCYNQGQRKMVSYDTPAVARKKVQYIREKGLGGGMWWELSGDRPVGDEKSLVGTTVQGFGGTECLDKEENLLEYPMSKWENLRAKFGDEQA